MPAKLERSHEEFEYEEASEDGEYSVATQNLFKVEIPSSEEV